MQFDRKRSKSKHFFSKPAGEFNKFKYFHYSNLLKFLSKSCTGYFWKQKPNFNFIGNRIELNCSTVKKSCN
jgi:hypothetical protein